MLSDFVSLESFYGHLGAALYLDELMDRYSIHDVCEAINGGLLEKRIICIGPDCGRCLCWLSDKGRSAVQ